MLNTPTPSLITTLKKYFGYDTFRDHQEEIITSILKGHDTMAIMPTGAGKSLCYQLPAILSDATTIVISPLISLMKDQVDYLNSIGVSATYLNSSLTGSKFKERLHGIYENQYKIIYVAPERLETDGFMNAINSLAIPCKQVIIDEAHCVSRWGHDFRPSYTRIREFIESLENRPTIAAFTATATETVRKDIAISLGLNQPNMFVTGFDRENLEFKVFINVQKDQYIKEFIREHKTDTGIIYAATRKECERIHTMFEKAGMVSAIYHAGLSDKERNQAQEDFIYDNVPVMIATNAFGMGIDKSNVRYVIHYNMPRDLESYYQEAGRAGRDGLPSECILLYSAGDTAVQKYFIDEGAISPDRKSHEYKNLQIMESYCHTTTCLRKYMLEYFGDHTGADNCANCSVCNNETEEKDVTLEVQMILSCINKSGQRFGRSIIVDTLRGSKNKKVLNFHLDKLKTYGLMTNYSKEQIDLFMNKLIAEGYLHKTEEQYPILKLTNLSIPLLKNQGTVTMAMPKKAKKKAVQNDLLTKLKELRKEYARKEGYPPYVIFHDATLLEMCSRMPRTLEELGEIKGVGENKREKYGESFLKVILEYIQEHGERQEPIDSEDIHNPSTKDDKISASNHKRMENNNSENQFPGMNIDENNANQNKVIIKKENLDMKQGIRNQESRDQESRDQETKDQETKDQETRDQETRDQELKAQEPGNQEDLWVSQEKTFDNSLMSQLNTLVNTKTNTNTNTDNNAITSTKTKPSTYLKYLTLYQECHNMTEIATTLSVTPITVENNLLKAYAAGEDIAIDELIQKEFELEIVKIILNNDWDGKLKYIKESLPTEATYTTIKAVIEKLKKKLGMTTESPE